MSPPTSSSDPDPAVVIERPRPEYFLGFSLPAPVETSDVARRWRVVVVTEGGDRRLRDFTYVPIGETTWADLPHPLLSGPIDQPGTRPVGTVERIWRAPAPTLPGDSPEVLWVWAEGVLDPGERMPRPYARHVLWVDEIEDTEAKLRANAGNICTKLGDDWRQQLADEMHCGPADVGIGVLAGHPSGRRPTDTPIGPIVSDLRTVDRRALNLTLHIDGHGWLEAATVPLDNPFLTERVALWRAELARAIQEATPGVDRTPHDPADNMRQRLDSLESGDPPDLTV